MKWNQLSNYSKKQIKMACAFVGAAAFSGMVANFHLEFPDPYLTAIWGVGGFWTFAVLAYVHVMSAEIRETRDDILNAIQDK